VTDVYPTQARAVAMACVSDGPVHVFGRLENPELYRLGMARRCNAVIDPLELVEEPQVIVHEFAEELPNGTWYCNDCGKHEDELEAGLGVYGPC
jgi:hypothetical protein